VTPNVGLEFFCESGNFSMSKKIYFGQSLIEVLERLGNPNKEYVKNDKQFLNYLELGIDVLIDNVDNSV